MSRYLDKALNLLRGGDFVGAEALCRKALKTPGSRVHAAEILADCLYNQGMSLLAYGQLVEAAGERFKEALTFDPKHPHALHNLGAIEEQAGRLDTAISYYKAALAAAPSRRETLRCLATAFQRCDALEASARTFDRLTAMDPSNAGLYRLRKALLVANIIPDANYPSSVRSHIREQLAAIRSNPGGGTELATLAAPYFFLSYHGICNADLHREIAETYLSIRPDLAWASPVATRPGSPPGRVRIGFASANLFNHSIGHTTRGLVEKLDRTKFEIIVIRLAPSPRDAMAEVIDSAADEVCTVLPNNLQAAREAIAARDLDILFYQDIGMEPFSYLLAFSRLAPIQMTSFGHPDTSGIPNMDYFISSALYETEGAEAHYSERLLQLPNAGTLAYYYRPTSEGEARRTDFGLPEDARLYFCPQTLFKIHPAMDDVFFGILARDPQARIVLIEPAAAHMRPALERRWAARQQAGGERIAFVKRLPHADYLRLMRCVDVMLDTVHFNGQNTNLEAFSFGLPVVTWPSTLQRGRHTLGMYRAMGSDDFRSCIALGAEDFAEKAVRIASDAALRRMLQEAIARRSGVLYENAGIIRAFEKAFESLVSERAA